MRREGVQPSTVLYVCVCVWYSFTTLHRYTAPHDTVLSLLLPLLLSLLLSLLLPLYSPSYRQRR